MRCPQCGYLPAGPGVAFGCWGHTEPKALPNHEGPLWINAWAWKTTANRGRIDRWPHGLFNEAEESHFNRSYPAGWRSNKGEMPNDLWYDKEGKAVSVELFEFRLKDLRVQLNFVGLSVRDTKGQQWRIGPDKVWRKE